MAVRMTSRQAYHETEDLRKKQERLVLDTIDGAGPAGYCIDDVWRELTSLGYTVKDSSVSARMNELKNHKDANGDPDPLIVPARHFKRPSRGTGRPSEHWMHVRWKPKPGTQKTFFRM